MCYGYEKMNWSQRIKTSAIFGEAVNEVQDPAWKAEWNVAGMEQHRVDALNAEKDAIMRKLALDHEENSLEEYLYNDAVINKTAWLRNVHVPEKGEIDSEIERVRIKEDMSALSQSQRTKRGKKFKEKAERQASAIRAVNLNLKGREIALESLINSNLVRGEHVHDGEEINDYLNNLDYMAEKGTMLHDIAFYAQWRDYAETTEGKKSDAAEFFKKLPKEKNRNRRTYQSRCMDMLNEDGYREECVRMLLELEKLDLDIFNYSSDEEFVKNYSYRMATLRAFSHTLTMRVNVRDDERIAKIYPKLSVKDSVIQSIINDYENRITLIRSPYYALMASKDLDKMPSDELEERIENAWDAGDYVVAEYLNSILNRREKRGDVLYINECFGKGVKASGLEKKAMKGYGEVARAAAAQEKQEAKADKKAKAKEKKEDEKLQKQIEKEMDPKNIAKRRRQEEEQQRKEEEKRLKEEEKERQEKEARAKRTEHEYAMNNINKYIENLGSYYPQVKKNNKKMKDADAIEAALQIRANMHTADFERDKKLHRIYSLRQIKNLNTDYTEYLVDFSESEKKAIKWLNDKLSFSGEKQKGGLNENVPALDAKLEVYYDKLIQLIRQCNRIEEATSSISNRGVDFDVLDDDYKDNKNFSKSEFALIKSVKDGIKNYRNGILNSDEHKNLCKEIKNKAREISNGLMEAYIKELNMSVDVAEAKLGPAMMIGKIQSRSKYDTGISLISGTLDVKSMTSGFPEEEANKANQIFFGKKSDKQTKTGYEERRQKAQKYRDIMDSYYAAREREEAECVNVKGGGEIRDERCCLPFLEAGERKAFLKAVAATNKRFSKMEKKDAVTVRKCMKKVFDHLLTLDLKTLEFNDDDEFFEKYDEIRKHAAVGFVLMKLIAKYKDVGGLLTAEESEKLISICHTFCGLEDYVAERSILAVNPDWVMMDHKKLEALSEDKLVSIITKQKEIKTLNERKAAEIEREQISLVEKKKAFKVQKDKALLNLDEEFAAYKIYAAVNKLNAEDVKKTLEKNVEDADAGINEAEFLLGEKAAKLDAFRKERDDAARHIDLAERLIKMKKLRAETTEGKMYNICEKTSLEAAVFYNRTVYEFGNMNGYWIGLQSGYATTKEKSVNGMWLKKDEKEDYSAIDKLYYMGAHKCIFAEMLQNKEPYEPEARNKTKATLSIALQGLLLQFKNVETYDDGNVGQKCNFRQFSSLILRRSVNRYNQVGTSLAMYEQVLTYAEELEKRFEENEKVREEVMESLSDEDAALYMDILDFAKKLLPMIHDLDRLLFEDIDADEAVKIQSAIETYLNMIYIPEKVNEDLGATKWAMPSKAVSYTDVLDAVFDESYTEAILEELKKRCYKAYPYKK